MLEGVCPVLTRQCHSFKQERKLFFSPLFLTLRQFESIKSFLLDTLISSKINIEQMKFQVRQVSNKRKFRVRKKCRTRFETLLIRHYNFEQK